MAPQPYPTRKQTPPSEPFTAWSPKLSPTSLSSTSPGTITNIVFGLCALFIGIFTIWQSRRAWVIWHAHRPASSHVPGGTVPAQVDVELGHPHASAPIEDQDQEHDQEDRSYPAAIGTESNDASAASLPTNIHEPAKLSSSSNKAPSSHLPGTSVSQPTENSTSQSHNHAKPSTPVSLLGRRPVVEGTVLGAEGLGSPAPGGAEPHQEAPNHTLYGEPFACGERMSQ